MSEEPREPEAGKKKELPLPSWKKMGEFLLKILQLERSVARLQQENKALDELPFATRSMRALNAPLSLCSSA